MPNYDFKTDLPIAKETELEVSRLLERLFGAKILEIEETNKYDILAEIKGKQVTFEVKEDFTCEKTGNIGLEFESWGRPAGIAISKADFYIYKAHTTYYGILFIIHKTDTLKKKIEDKKYFKIVCGGDAGSNSMNYLFRLEEFVKDGWQLQ